MPKQTAVESMSRALEAQQVYPSLAKAAAEDLTEGKSAATSVAIASAYNTVRKAL